MVFISNDFKRDLANKFEKYSTICEDGIASWIPGAESFNETGYFGLNKLNFSDYIHFFKNYFHNRFIVKTHKSPLVSRVKSIKTFKELIPIREELINSCLSEPQGMNFLIGKSCGGTIENPKGELPLRIKRYFYEAKTSLNYAKENNLDELHILVGCAHELPLEYLLKNREILKRYSL